MDGSNSTGYTLERSPDGASVTWLDGGLIFREAGLGRLEWAPADQPDTGFLLNTLDALALELAFPDLLWGVRMTFMLPIGSMTLGFSKELL
jgi:hypothetical protein